MDNTITLFLLEGQCTEQMKIENKEEGKIGGMLQNEKRDTTKELSH